MAAQLPQALQVAGCSHDSIGVIVNGQFTVHSNNHNRPVYKKTEMVRGHEVLIYFWDERDGQDFAGWWFGPKVGGDQVWAFHPEKAAAPPPNGWRVPYGGPIDTGFAVAPMAMHQQAPTGHVQQVHQPPPPQLPPPPGMPQQQGTTQQHQQQGLMQQHHHTPQGMVQQLQQQQQQPQPQPQQQGMVQQPARPPIPQVQPAQQFPPGPQGAQAQLQHLLSSLPSHRQVLSQQQLALINQACLTQPAQVQQLVGSLIQQQRQAQQMGQQQQLTVQAQMQQMQATGNLAGLQQLQLQVHMQGTQMQQQAAQLQQHHLQQLQQLANNQQAAEDEKRKKVDEQRQKMEEKRRNMIEEQRKRQEEMLKKQQEEKARLAAEKAKREAEMKKRMNEQRVLFNMRKILNQLRTCNVETYDAKKQELDELLAKEKAENDYEPSEAATKEMDNTIEQTRMRIEKLRAQHEAMKKKREEEQKKYEDAKEKSENLVKELVGSVEAAESGLKTLEEILARFKGDGELDVDDVEEVTKSVDTAQTDAKAAIKVCTEHMVKHAAAMREPKPPPGTTPLPKGLSESQKLLATLVTRINTLKERQMKAGNSIPAARAKAKKKVVAQLKTKELKAVMKKYDLDKDSMLSKPEIRRFAKQEFKCTLKESVLDKIFRTDVLHPIVQEGKKGVELDALHMVRIHIGISRELERDAKRRKMRIEKEESYKREIQRFSDRVKELSTVVEMAEDGVLEAEQKVNPLPTQGKKLAPPEMLELAKKGEVPIKKAMATVADARDQWEGMFEGFDKNIEKDLRTFLRSDLTAKKCVMRMGKLEMRQQRMTQIVKNIRIQAMKTSEKELRRLKTAGLKILRHNRRVKKLTPEELFDLIDKDGDGEVDEQEFVAFMTEADKDIKKMEVELSTREVALEDEPSPPGGAASKSPTAAPNAAPTESGPKPVGKQPPKEPAPEEAVGEGAADGKKAGAEVVEEADAAEAEVAAEAAEEEEEEEEEEEDEEEEDLMALTIPKLQARLKEKGLPHLGKKADLIARLKEQATSDKNAAAEEAAKEAAGDAPAKAESEAADKTANKAAEDENGDADKGAGESAGEDASKKAGEDGAGDHADREADEAAEGKAAGEDGGEANAEAKAKGKAKAEGASKKVKKYKKPDPEAARKLDLELKKFTNGAVRSVSSLTKTVTEARFVEREEQVELSAADLPKLFACYLKEDSQTIPRDALLELIRVCCTVLRSPGADSGWEAARALEVGEVVEVLQGPEEDEASKELRVMVKALVDDTEGWITLVKSDGSRPFLQEGGLRLRTLKEMTLTDSHMFGGAVLRKLAAGERLAMLEWPAKDEASGSMRAKVTPLPSRAVSGFVTTVDDKGKQFVEVVG